MTRRELIALKRSDILEIARKHGVSNIRLFGSVARGEENPDGDIDFLIELEPDRSLLDYAGFMLAMRELLGVKVDVVTEGGLKDRMRERVLSEAVVL